jgi:hypothetical protein
VAWFVSLLNFVEQSLEISVIFHYTIVVVQHSFLWVAFNSCGVKHRESLQSFWRKVSTNRSCLASEVGLFLELIEEI